MCVCACHAVDPDAPTSAMIANPAAGLFKSTDGGTTWKPLTRGLPTFADGLSRIGIAVAPSEPKRIYAIVQASARADDLYRSDDAGESRRQVNSYATAVRGSGDYAEVKVAPKNPDVIYTAETICWKSTDGGKTFAPFLGGGLRERREVCAFRGPLHAARRQLRNRSVVQGREAHLDGNR